MSSLYVIYQLAGRKYETAQLASKTHSTYTNNLENRYAHDQVGRCSSRSESS
jgi:hypothetical protein